MTPSGYLRYTILEQIEAFADDGVPRVLGAFSNISEEAKNYAELAYRSYAAAAEPGADEFGDLSEEAHNQGIQHYQVLNDLRQAITNLLAAGFYHLFEQHRSKLEALLTQRRMPLPSFESAPTWSTVDELRLVANTVKHAEGGSARQLRAVRPDLFVHPNSRGTQMEAVELQRGRTENPLGGTDLFLAPEDLNGTATPSEIFGCGLSHRSSLVPGGPPLPNTSCRGRGAGHPALI